MPPANSVSVFHFSQKISDNKIQKYKLATERGMGNKSQAAIATPVAHSPPSMASASPPLPSTEPTGSMEPPPAKKPRLKLNVRAPPSESPVSSPPAVQTLASSRPRRESSMRTSFSASNPKSTESKKRARRSTSSDLSSIASTPLIATPPSPKVAAAKAPVPKRKAPEGEYGDFMSYYITGGDDDAAEESKAEEAAPAPPKQERLQSQPQPQPAKQPIAAPAPTTRKAPPPPKLQQQHVAPRQTHQPQVAHRAAPPPATLKIPTVQVVDFPLQTKENVTGDQETVEVMVKKLESLTASLASFGGASSGQAPKVEVTNKPEPPKPAAPTNVVDGLLGMFEDDSDDEDTEKPQKEQSKSSPLDYKLGEPGAIDGPLAYGIQFIQNALKSWAQQRLQQQFNVQFLQADRQSQAQFQAPPAKRGSGNQQSATQQMAVQANLIDTPEGLAVQAFQDVLNSGCLQINGIFPAELTRALGALYSQIDTLINFDNKKEDEWRCMSYGAQIAANRARVDQWTQNQARAQEDMARQQQLAHQHMLQQMGLPQVPITEAMMRQQHAMELDHKRSMQYAAREPHIMQHLLHPMNMAAQSPGPPQAYGARPPQYNGGMNTPSSAGPSQGQPSRRRSSVASGHQSTPDEQSKTPASAVPRSGTQLKLSFSTNRSGAESPQAPVDQPLVASDKGKAKVNGTTKAAAPVTSAKSSPAPLKNGAASKAAIAQSTGKSTNEKPTKSSTKKRGHEEISKDDQDDDDIVVAKAPRIGGFTAVNA